MPNTTAAVVKPPAGVCIKLRPQAVRQVCFTAPDKVNVITDTAYFGKTFGVTVLYGSTSKQALPADAVKYKTNALYLEAPRSLQKKGIHIQAVICDGRRGLTGLFPGIPVQLCRFHQVKTINRHLTRNPKTAAAQELRKITLPLKTCSRAAFTALLKDRHKQHKNFLNEHTVNTETGKPRYTHGQLRSAYNSLKNNLPYLFAFEYHPDFNLPKTTNLPEGKFGGLKTN
ncbi:IS256 family transposase, variant Zn-binding type [Neisseria iguanae]|uniref:IS256 family transposase, variant Zn-binding type n=1 Tax=Neisseria iguanae TaxID=90242 RepID=UPI001B805ACE|nr:hypothetical protein [Neisseria iguanae]